MGGHDIFSNGVVESIDGGATQGGQYGEESLIHEWPVAWQQPFFWHYPNKSCFPSVE